VYSCPLCPERFCLCASAAWEASKRHVQRTGASVTIETIDGVRMAETKASGGGGPGFSIPSTKGRKRRAPGGAVVEEPALAEDASDDVDEELQGDVESDEEGETDEVSLEELAEQEAEDVS
jgi:hypothetical protein